MAAPKGNKYWEFREKHGRNHKYTPEGLWIEAKNYFEWIENNPLLEDKLFAFQGVVTHDTTTKMRAMTISSFCIFADITDSTFANYRKENDFFAIITRIEKIIYAQKFEGAAADMLNPNIIARELGLKEKTDITTKGEAITNEINVSYTDLNKE